ncbi:hypothetical protein NC651_026780 [Populus alba x Populus x berolinensis]|nr:hypothetical protein NC651_026780 [Populus alba x Populus x berolinensis]
MKIRKYELTSKPAPFAPSSRQQEEPLMPSELLLGGGDVPLRADFGKSVCSSFLDMSFTCRLNFYFICNYFWNLL